MIGTAKVNKGTIIIPATQPKVPSEAAKVIIPGPDTKHIVAIKMNEIHATATVHAFFGSPFSFEMDTVAVGFEAESIVGFGIGDGVFIIKRLWLYYTIRNSIQDKQRFF